MIVGGCFEVGRQDEAAPSPASTSTPIGGGIWRRRVGRDGARGYCAMLDDWLAWRRAHPTAMDFAATFYLDQRLSGWRAALEHGYDLLRGSRSTRRTTPGYSAR